MKRSIALFCALSLLLFAVVGCGAASSDQMNDAPRAAGDSGMAPSTESARWDTGAEATEEYYYDDDEEEPWDEADDVDGIPGGSSIDVPQESRKMVYTVDLSLQTTEFDDGVEKIPTMLEAAGGFIEESYIEGTNLNDRYPSRNARFTLRLPSDQLDTFTKALGEEFHLVSQQKSAQNITANYYDTQSRLRSLQLQQEQLEKMLAGSTELKYMLEVQQELAEVQYQIDAITSSLRRMDNAVGMSTLNLRLQEVSIYDPSEPLPEPITFGDRVRATLGDSWSGLVSFCQGIVLVLVALLPFLPLIAAIVLLIIFLTRRRKKKRRDSRMYGDDTTVKLIPLDGEPDPNAPDGENDPEPKK